MLSASEGIRALTNTGLVGSWGRRTIKKVKN
jgi:hypothetical protein